MIEFLLELSCEFVFEFLIHVHFSLEFLSVFLIIGYSADSEDTQHNHRLEEDK